MTQLSYRLHLSFAWMSSSHPSGAACRLVPELWSESEGSLDQLDGAPPPATGFGNDPEGVRARACRSTLGAASFMGNQNDPCRRVPTDSRGDQLEEDGPPWFRECGTTPRPEDDLGAGFQVDPAEEKTKSRLESMVAACQHEGISSSVTGSLRGSPARERPHQVAHLAIFCPRIWQLAIASNPVSVPPSDASALEETIPDEIGHDRLHRSRRDVDLSREVAEAEISLPRQRHEHHPVV